MHMSPVIFTFKNFFCLRGLDKKIWNYLLKDCMQINGNVKEGKDYAGKKIQELQMWIHSFPRPPFSNSAQEMAWR